MRVEENVIVEAGPRQVWSTISDPERVAPLMAGVSRWEAKNGKRRGLGARYLIRMQVGSAQLGGTVEVVEYEPTSELAWVSVTGVTHRGRWRLRQDDDGRTQVSLRLSYQAPGGLLALIADRLAAPMVRAHLRRTLHNLKGALEQGTGSSDPLVSLTTS